MKGIFFILTQVLLFSALASAQATKVVYTCPMHAEIQQAKPGDCPKCGMNLEKKTIKAAAPKTAPRQAVKTSPTARKAADTTKTNTGNDDLREMVKEMRGTVEELKTSVAELKDIVQDMKSTGDQTDTASADEYHDHDMNMENADTSNPVTKQVYTCPMHPEVQSEKPGKCPKCGMTLIRKTVPVNQPNKQANTHPTQTKIVYTCVMHPEVQQDKPGNCPKCGMTLTKKTVQVSKPTNSNNNNGQRQQSNMALADEMVGSRVNLQTGKTVV